MGRIRESLIEIHEFLFTPLLRETNDKGQDNTLYSSYPDPREGIRRAESANSYRARTRAAREGLGLSPLEVLED